MCRSLPDGDGARRAEWARRLERVPLPASNAAPCSYWKHQNAPTLPSRLAEACFLAHFGLRGCKAGFSVQARRMLRMRGRGAGAAAPCTRELACLGSGNAAAASDLDAQAPRSFCWTRSFGSMCRRRRAVRRSSFRGWTRRGAPFCAAASFRHQMRCAQAARGVRLRPCCRVGSPQLACGESGVSSDAGGRTWKASRELRCRAGSCG